ncbi:MAG: MOSC domain-containing protein [Rhodothermales bacterium]
MSHVFQLNTSPGGVPKRAVQAVAVGPLGLEGDGVNHPKVHGGPERAVCLWSLDRILALQAEGHPIFPGAVGENVTLAGLDWSGLGPGSVLDLGDAVRLEVTKYTTPCNTIAAYFAERQFKRISEERHPGWSRLYARVLRPGTLRVGDVVRIVD